MYFDVADGFYFNDPQSVILSIDYFNEGSGSIFVEYDAACATNWRTETIYKQLPIAVQSNTKTWKTTSVTLTDATFAGHKNNLMDFRIAGYETPLIINRITISEK